MTVLHDQTVEVVPFLPRTMGGSRMWSNRQSLWRTNSGGPSHYPSRFQRNSQHNGNALYIIASIRGGFEWYPTEHFVKDVVPEFIDMRMGYRRAQVFSTRKHSEK
jgi:hypothetical protein